MTIDEIREATAEAVVAAEHLSAHLERLLERMRAVFPLSGDVLIAWEDEPRERLHALLRMFEQLFDLTSRKLFFGLLALSGEQVTALSAKNRIRKIEALGGIDAADRWLELGATRNILVHDYPTDPAAQAARANRAWSDVPVLIEGTRQTIAMLRSEELL